MPTFDCRVFNVPSLEEASNVFVWRQQDAIRNSIEMAARAHFSHKECLSKTCAQLQEMLFQRKGINWAHYEDDFRRGSFVRKTYVERRYAPVEIADLPPKHEARSNPNLVVRRRTFVTSSFEVARLCNRQETLFLGFSSEPDFEGMSPV